MKTTLLLITTLLSYSVFAQTLPQTNTTRAVIIGIANYQDAAIPDLRFSDRDAKAFVEYLQSPAGGALSEDQMIILLNEKATNSRIADALIWLLEESKAGDKAIIYFSGHGDVETITRFNRGYLLTYDSPPKVYMAGALNIRDLQDIISTLSEQEVQVIMISDACRAGKLAGSEVGGTAATAQNLSKQFANEIKILSCQPNEFSLEGEQWGGGRGAFSYHLLDGLQGLADKNKDAQVNLFEIGRYLEDLVPMETAPHSQMPFTVGDRNTQLAMIDEAVLAKLEKEKAQTQQMLSMIETKGMEELVLEKVDTTIKEMYAAFTVALENKELLEPSESCAYDLYQKLTQEASIKDLHNIMRRNLSVALQEGSQQAVNAYLAANPTEINRRYESEEDYSFYPRYLEKAAELLGEKHFYYKNLMAKLYYFEGLKIRLDADNDVENATYQNAIDKQLKALEYQEYAPFILNELGVLYTRKRDSEKAIPYYKTAIEIAPEWGLPYVNLCVESFYNGNNEKAIEYGEKALELMPEYPQLLNLLGWIHADRKEDGDRSRFSRRGLELNDDFAYRPNNLLNRYEKKIYYKRSIELLERAVSIDSNYVAGYLNLGICYSQIEENEKAIIQLKKAVQLDSTNQLIHGRLADAYKIAGKYEEAKIAYEKAIALADSTSWDYLTWHLNFGTLYMAWGKDEKAIKHLLIDIEKRNGTYAHINMATIYGRKGDNEKAEWHILQSIRNSHTNFIRALGGHYENMNRPKDAEWMYLKSLEILPGYHRARNNLIDLYQKTGKFDKAAEMTDTLLALAPDIPLYYINAGKLYYLKKQPEKAELYFQKAMSLNGISSSDMNSIAAFYVWHSEYKLGKKYAEKAIEIDSTHYFARVNQAACLSYLGYEKEAFEKFEYIRKNLNREEGWWINVLFSLYNKKYDEALHDLDSLIHYAPQYKGISQLIKGLKKGDYEKVDSLMETMPDSLANLPPYFQGIAKAKLGRFKIAKDILTMESNLRKFPYGLYSVMIKDTILFPKNIRQDYQKFLRQRFPEKFEEIDSPELEQEGQYFFNNCITLGKYYESHQAYELANNVYKKAVELRPDSLTKKAARDLVEIYLKLGQFTEARSICLDTITTANPFEYAEVGRLLYNSQKFEQAEKLFQKAISLDTLNAAILNYIGWGYKNYGSFDLAEKYLFDCIEKKIDLYHPYINLALLYYTEGSYPKMMEILERGLKAIPSNNSLKELQVILGYFSNQKEASKKSFEAAAQKNPAFLDAWNFLEQFHNEEYAKAKKTWNAFNGKIQTWYFVHLYISALAKSGDIETAIKVMNKQGSYSLNYQLLTTHPSLEPLRDTQAYVDYIRRNFPEKVNQ